MIACRRVRCGSSVYVQKKWSTDESSGGGALTDDVSLAAVVATRRWDADVEVIDAMAEKQEASDPEKDLLRALDVEESLLTSIIC